MEWSIIELFFTAIKYAFEVTRSIRAGAREKERERERERERELKPLELAR